MGNQQTKGYYGRRIDWEHAERPSPPGKPYLSPDTADLPDIIKIRWATPMSDGGAPIIGYVVEHRRTGSPHWLRASPHLATDTELVLTGLEPGWRYQFRVSAENAIGRSDPGELSEPLTVTLQRSAASAPHFNKELQDIIALENDTVEFIVQVIATPAPKISWYKDGFEMFSSRRTKISTDNETSTLIIYNAALEDEGEIKCSATNRAGHVVTKAYLKLEALPRIRLPRQYEEGLIFEKGETIRLKVSSAGRPPPIIEWHHNGQLITSGGRYDVSSTEHGSTLRISDGCRDDRGEYLVMGSNHNGEDFVSFLVTITDRPVSPGKPQVTMTLGRSVTLTWTEPDDDGGCKIGTYIVEYFRIGWDMWLKAASSRQLTAVLSELIEGSEYKFRVKAENPYGVSEPSEESEVIFIPDPKHGILKPERKISPLDAPPPNADNVEKREAPKEQSVESDTVKRRRLLEESARKLLDSPVSLPRTDSEEKKRSAPTEQSSETDASKRRKLLEEKARKLLDTPLSVLLNSTAPSEVKTMEKPPRRRAGDSRSTTVSPTPGEEGSSPPPVPKRRKAKLLDSAAPSFSSPSPSPLPPSPSFLRNIPSPSISPRPVTPASIRDAPSPSISSGPVSPIPLRKEAFPGPMSPVALREDGMVHGSSELVLILLPERGRTKSAQLSDQQKAEIELRLSEPGVAPPMSLSAPELGSEEPLEMPLLREAVSSTELLHERAMSRLYQDAAEEEMKRDESRRKSLERRPSLRGITVERRHSLKESSNLPPKVAAALPPSKSLVNKPTPPASPRLTTKIPTAIENKKTEKPPKLTRDDRMNSAELEQLEFARVREKLRIKNEEQVKDVIPPRPPNLKQQASLSSQMSSFDAEETYEEDDELYEEELEEEELGEEEEEYIEDEELGEGEEEEEEVQEEEMEWEEIYKKKNDENDKFLNFVNESKLRSTSSSPERKPPAVPLHGILKKTRGSAVVVEEDTYHPRSMIPTRSVVRAVPAVVETGEPHHEMSMPMITLNDETNQIKDSAEDKAHAKRKEREKSPKLLREIPPTNDGERLGREKSPKLLREVPPKNDGERLPKKTEDIKTEDKLVEERNGKDLEKAENLDGKIKKESRIPIKKPKLFGKIGFLKKDKQKQMQGITIATLIKGTTDPVSSVALPKPILKKKQTSLKKKDKKKHQENTVTEETDGKTRKQVRIAEPGSLAVPASDDPNISPLTKKRNERLQRRQQSLEEEEEANKVLICYYSDIVREFGGPKKPQPKLYLDIEELEAHAAPGSLDTLNSEQEERGSGPDLTDVVSDQGSAPDLTLDEPIEEKAEEIEEIVEEVKAEEEVMESKSEVVEEEGETLPSESPSIRATPSPTPSSSHSTCLTPEERTRSLIDYLTDVGIFIFACWLYLFKSELYVIPVLILLVYRQLQTTVQVKYRSAKRAIVSKLPRRLGGGEKAESEPVQTNGEDDD